MSSVADDELLYDGSFDLTFLRDGETVGATGDGDGSCWVEQSTGPGTARGMRLDVGDVLVRRQCGDLFAYTPSKPEKPSLGLLREAERRLDWLCTRAVLEGWRWWRPAYSTGYYEGLSAAHKVVFDLLLAEAGEQRG